MSSGLSEINNKMKGWPGWVLLLVVIVSVLAVGSTRASGPAEPRRADRAHFEASGVSGL